MNQNHLPSGSVPHRDFAFFNGDRATSVELSEYHTEPVFDKHTQTWSFPVLPQVMARGQKEQSVLFNQQFGESPQQILDQAQQEYSTQFNRYLSEWQQRSGQSKELVDLLAREYIQRVWAVGTSIDDKAKENGNEFYLPSITNHIVRYTTNGRDMHNIHFNQENDARKFHNRSVEVLWDGYFGRMIQFASQEIPDRTLLLILPNGQVIEVYNHGRDATLKQWTPGAGDQYWNGLNPTFAMTEAARRAKTCLVPASAPK